MRMWTNEYLYKKMIISELEVNQNIVDDSNVFHILKIIGKYLY